MPQIIPETNGLGLHSYQDRGPLIRYAELQQQYATPDIRAPMSLYSDPVALDMYIQGAAMFQNYQMDKRLADEISHPHDQTALGVMFDLASRQIDNYARQFDPSTTSTNLNSAQDFPSNGSPGQLYS